MLSRFLHRSQGSQWSTRDQVAAELVRVAERITRAELPDPAARAALISAIRAGAIIGVYTPCGYADRHTIELAHVPHDLDPRTTCAQWVAWWQAGKDAAAEHVAARRTEQLQARLAATPGQIKQFDERCRERLAEMEHTGELTPRVVAHLRAEMERTAPDVTAYAYRLTGVGACVWDDTLARHCTAAEYDAYLAALAEIRRAADGLAGEQAAQGGQG